MVDGSRALKREVAQIKDIVRAQAIRIDRLEKLVVAIAGALGEYENEDLSDVIDGQSYESNMKVFVRWLCEQPSEILDMSYDPKQNAKLG